MTTSGNLTTTLGNLLYCGTVSLRGHSLSKLILLEFSNQGFDKGFDKGCDEGWESSLALRLRFAGELLPKLTLTLRDMFGHGDPNDHVQITSPAAVLSHAVPAHPQSLPVLRPRRNLNADTPIEGRDGHLGA